MSNFVDPFQPTLSPQGMQTLGLSGTMQKPNKLLLGKVYCYLQISTKTVSPYPVVPDGTQAIYFSSRGIRIGGAQVQTQDLQLEGGEDYFGIWFYPGALRHFFDLNLSEITGQFVDAQYFNCPQFSNLHFAIYGQETFAARVKICESWLMKQFSPRPRAKFEHALHLINQSYGNIRVADLAAEISCSARHLNRHFLEYTGLNTKSFSQLIRLQQTLKHLHGSTTKPLDTLLAFGYYDQAHLIKSFQKYLSANPSAFINRFMSDLYNQ